MTGRRRRFRPDPSLKKPKLGKRGPSVRSRQAAPAESTASPTAARWVAFRALQAFREREVFVSRVLDDQFSDSGMRSRDRKLATELANETIRRQGTIDTLLQRFVSRPRENVEPDLWTILQLGCVQIVCLPHISVHAAVNESVELCSRIENPKAKGFVNGVLRNIERAVVTRDESETVSLADMNGRTLPLLQQSEFQTRYQCVRFAEQVLQEPARDALTYVGQVASLPEWLMQRLVGQSSADDDMLRMGLWMTTQGRMSLRVNPLQTDREKVLEVLAAAKVPARPGVLSEAVELGGSVAIIDLPGYREGWFSVQDVSAMSATDLLDPQPGETVLDLCAAPGGKTTHIAERMHNRGRVLACDIVENRLKTIHENARRLRLDCIETQLLAENGDGLPHQEFDAILVDVPCSNTGVLGKRPEARWRLMPLSFRELIPLQVQLLKRALERVRPGGRVVYSTCSIDDQENAQVVRTTLNQVPGVELRTERMHQPGAPSDGGYQALLIR